MRSSILGSDNQIEAFPENKQIRSVDHTTKPELFASPIESNSSVE